MDDQPRPGWDSPPPPSRPSSYPPPGGPAPPPGPQYRPGAPVGTPPGGWRPSGPVPVRSGAAHKPGAVPLRPLGLGDIYDAAFKTIRHNPKATVGAALLVAAVGMAIPVLVTAVLSPVLDLSVPTTIGQVGTADLLGGTAPTLALLAGSLVSGIGLIFVTGMIAHVCLAAALGRTLTLGEAWAATRGRRWHLVGLSLVLVLMVTLLLGAYLAASVAVVALVDPVVVTVVWFVLTVPALVAVLWFVWIRLYYLPVPALMIERTGVLESLRRGFVLTRGQFWRTFGIALLTAVVVWFASQLLSTPLALVGTFAGLAMGESQWSALVLVATQSAATVLATAFTAPFQAAVTSVQYLDLRFRREGFDLELMQRAGLTPPLGPPAGAPPR